MLDPRVSALEEDLDEVESSEDEDEEEEKVRNWNWFTDPVGPVTQEDKQKPFQACWFISPLLCLIINYKFCLRMKKVK